jgi:DNA-directed RNA polymerase specialized sigma24 family protein
MLERTRDKDSLYEGIVSALREMPEPLVKVFILSHYHGLSESRIAQETGVTEQDVQDMLREANRFFRGSLEPLAG